MIDVVVMRGRTVLVVISVNAGMHMQLGRLHVHQRESGNQRDREHPTESRYHLAPTSYYIPASGQNEPHLWAQPIETTYADGFGAADRAYGEIIS
jgi:hypothetical protein